MDRKLRHPSKKSLTEALTEDAPAIKARKGLIDKKATMFKAAADGDTENGIYCPNDEQLAKINQFTRTPKTAEEVVCFPTLSCNDLVDRDDDQFTAACVKDFAELEQPFSSVGKSYMVDHEYKIANAVGRIFDVGTKKVGSGLFLTNEVYIPNTESNQKFIEDIDFGINWAVSVGVVLGKDGCTVCGERFSAWGWWCVNGHDKGLYYTKDAEEDAYGWPIPCDPNTKGAIRCVRQFSEPKDFYELSQVFLGAQYYASLDKDPAFSGILKAASAENPMVNLSAEEARKLPLRHEPERVSEARIRFGVSELEDGTLKWIDDRGLIWIFDPENPEDIMSLGKQSNNEEEDDADGQVIVDEDAAGDEGSGEPEVSDDADEAGSGSGESSDHSAEGSEQPLGSDEGSLTPEQEEEKSVDKKRVAEAAKQAGLPTAVLGVLTSAEGDGLDALLLACSSEFENLRKEVGTLTSKAALGDQYVEDMKSTAIDWYVKAHQGSDDKPVSTATFQRILDRCGDDVDLIKELTEENKALAQQKFPSAVRRSSFPIDPNERGKAPDVDFGEGDERVSKLHS